MANYKEQIGTGSAWTRCKAIAIENPLSGLAYVNFTETRCASVGEFSSEQFTGVLHKEFNPSEEIELRDPSTGEAVGATMTHGELYVALYSLYIQTATERDAAVAAAASAAVQELPPLFPTQP